MQHPNLRTSSAIGLGLGLGLLAASTASASLTSTLVQVDATGGELDEAGYTQLGSSPFISLPNGECAVNGCVTLAGASSSSISKGYLEFQFQNYTYNPFWYSGIFATRDVDFGATGMTMNQLIALINVKTATTRSSIPPR